jgi:hypothetical protein
MEFKPAQKYIVMMKLRKKGFGTKFLCLCGPANADHTSYSAQKCFKNDEHN